MKTNFIKLSLADIASKEKGSIISGPFGSNIGSKFFQETGVPVIRGNNLSNGYQKFKDEGFVFISVEKADELKTYAIKDDLLFTAAGTIGQVGLIDNRAKYSKYIISNKQMRVRLDIKKVSPLYAYYWFSSPWIVKDIINKNTGSTVPLINLSVIKALEIKIPIERKTQDEIASVLSSLDSKIELGNRINAELEAMAKTLYNYWFVQFDFPDADGRPYKTSGGKMVWNDELKREIPEGCEVKMLADIASLISRGVSPSYTEIEGIVVLNQKCIRNGSVNFALGRRHNHKQKDATAKLINVGDVLVNSTGVGTLGRVAVVKYLEEPLTTVDSHVSIVRINNNKANQSFIGYSLSLKQVDIEALGEGSTGQTELSRDNLGKLKMILPSSDQQKKFDDFITPIFQKISVNERESRQLSELRDWLLPMLMNGQVKVGGYAMDEEEEQSYMMAAEPEVEYRREKK